MQDSEQSDSSQRGASFSTLPPELQLRILSECDPLSLVRISAASHATLAIARADSLWRNISLDLITAHRFPDHYAGDRGTPPPAHEEVTSDWYSLAAFLLHNAHHLGYFASSQPFTSRIIRVGIVGPAPAQVQPDAPPPRYTIRAAQLVPRNALANALALPSPPQQLLPFGAIQHALEPGSWLVSPRANPSHPYAGYSVDFLEPTYSFEAEMFDILPGIGACLPRGNSHTREAIAAAALGPAYEQHATSASDSSSSSPRLRLALEPVSQAVSPSSPSTSRLDPDPTSQSETNPDPMERLELNREALFALFSGRLPRRPWPTAQLVGLDWINSAELPYLRAGRTDPPRNVFRQSPSGGAFRGLEEWLTERKGGQRALARIVEPDFAATAAARRGAVVDDRAYVTGFRLRAKRMPTSPVMGTAMGAGASTGEAGGGRGQRPAAAGEVQPRASASDNPRRRGIGPNGGMAVLWQGRERDPDEDRPPPITTILRAGDDGGGDADAPGGFVLHVPGSPLQAPPPPPMAPLGGVRTNENDNHNEDRPADEVVDSATAEGFFPIKSPAEPLSWTNSQDRNRDHTAATDEHGHLLAHSLEGYWIGPYSSHGLEILNLTTGLAEFPATAADDSSSDSSDDDSSDSEDGRRLTYRRVITATKVTGDPNVPSGQTSWLAILPAAAMSTHLANLADGPVPSVEADKFHLLSSLDPSSASYQSLNNGAGPDWTEGCARAYGRIALTGYTSPSYSPAEIRFLRRETRLCNPDRPGEERTVETIEEIHVRWLEMHKVTVFKRMRI